MKTVQQFLIALGSNMPEPGMSPADTLRAALAALVPKGVVVLAQSRIYHTPCFPVGAGPDYANAAARVRYDGDAAALLGKLHEVETGFGRNRLQRWGARVLDLDLVAAGAAVLPDAETWAYWYHLPAHRQMVEAPDRLILPHPRLQDRAFVLVPLAEIAPDWAHPVLGKSVADMLAALPEDSVSGIEAM